MSIGELGSLFADCAEDRNATTHAVTQKLRKQLQCEVKTETGHGDENHYIEGRVRQPLDERRDHRGPTWSSPATAASPRPPWPGSAWSR